MKKVFFDKWGFADFNMKTISAIERKYIYNFYVWSAYLKYIKHQ